MGSRDALQVPAQGLKLEDHYLDMFQQAGVGLSELDLEGHFRRVNPALENLLERSQAELIGQNVRDLTPASYWDQARRLMQELVAGQRASFTVEKPHLLPDGGYRWLEVTGTLMRNATADPIGIAGVAVDIQARKDSETARGRLLQVLEATPDVIALADPDWTLTYINPAGLCRLGVSCGGTGLEMPLAVHGLKAGELAHPPWARRRIQEQGIPAALARGHWEGRTAFVDAQGRESPASQMVLAHRDADGQLLGLSTLIRDLSREQALEDELRLLAKVFDISQAIIITDARGVIERVNQAFTDITGYTQQEAEGRTPALLKSGYHEEAFYERMWDQLRREGHWSGQILNRRKNGETYYEWESISAVSDEDGQVQHYVAVFHELTTEQRLALEREANTDALTGLLNRASMERCLERERARAEQQDAPLGLLMLDVDHFKPINDRYGHEVGDQVLRKLADTIRQQVRRSDCAGRWGGEEFVVLLPEANLDAATGVAEKLCKAVAGLEVAPVDGITVSLGVAALRQGESADDLIRRLDAALYKAKENGRNRVATEQMA